MMLEAEQTIKYCQYRYDVTSIAMMLKTEQAIYHCQYLENRLQYILKHVGIEFVFVLW